jgi:hypothetical protein
LETIENFSQRSEIQQENFIKQSPQKKSYVINNVKLINDLKASLEKVLAAYGQ